jgi:hypothetical protein
MMKTNLLAAETAAASGIRTTKGTRKKVSTITGTMMKKN